MVAVRDYPPRNTRNWQFFRFVSNPTWRIYPPVLIALQWRMPELTRRRSTDAREECWHIYYGDVHAGTIAIRTGNPHDEDPWEWHCGFYPGSEPGEQQNGTAATFDEARTDFENAWRVFLSKRTEADFRAWRDQRDWTARKYEMWTTGEKLPSQKPGSMMRCPCGEMFDSHRLENTLIHVPHITAEHKSREVRRAQTVQ
jgi:hypothetical protein